MECIKKEFVRTDANGRKWWRVILTAMETPEKLILSGADVDGMDDSIGFESGSVLITPDGEFVACEDENFGTEPRGGIKSVSIDPSLPLYDLDGNPTTFGSAFPLYYDQMTRWEIGSSKITTFRTTEQLVEGSAFIFTITPTANWHASYDTAIGEPTIYDSDTVNNAIRVDIEAPENADSSTGNVIIDELNIFGGFDPTKPAFVAHADEDGRLDKTWQEVHDAFFGGAKSVYIDWTIDGMTIHAPVVDFADVDGYVIYSYFGGEDWTYGIFFSETADGYPVIED